MGYHQLHAPPLHVNSEIQSPTLAKFARDGVVLSSYYSYKYCGPSRASLLTGRLPGHGISEMMWSPAQPGGYNANLTMLSAKLRGVGYRTVGLGKWCANPHADPHANPRAYPRADPHADPHTNPHAIPCAIPDFARLGTAVFFSRGSCLQDGALITSSAT